VFVTGEKGKGEGEEEGEVVSGVLADGSSAAGCDAFGRWSCEGGRGMGTPERGSAGHMTMGAGRRRCWGSWRLTGDEADRCGDGKG
jgi:hypothetical protein